MARQRKRWAEAEAEEGERARCIGRCRGDGWAAGKMRRSWATRAWWPAEPRWTPPHPDLLRGNECSALVPSQPGEKIVTYPVRPVDTSTDFEGTKRLQPTQPVLHLVG